jgi:hypothetical protein
MTTSSRKMDRIEGAEAMARRGLGRASRAGYRGAKRAGRSIALRLASKDADVQKLFMAAEKLGTCDPLHQPVIQLSWIDANPRLA